MAAFNAGSAVMWFWLWLRLRWPFMLEVVAQINGGVFCLLLLLLPLTPAMARNNKQNNDADNAA
jgi:hypothetical protein